MMFRPVFLFLPLLLFAGFSTADDHERKIIYVMYPEFASWKYGGYDFPLSLEMFDSSKNRVDVFFDNYLTTVDSFSRSRLIMYNYTNDSLEFSTKTELIETFKRISANSWLRQKNGKQDTVYENRSHIVYADTIEIESGIKSGEYFTHVVSYYAITVNKP
ncbi:MAG: hypothetical protein IM638_10955 [Bacteroidetes bacterium]|nr:hypothetical protein [Bacteroidota bacterium]